jgi:hypothetical protein
MKFIPLSEVQGEEQGQAEGGLKFVPLEAQESGLKFTPVQPQAEMKAWEPSAFEEILNVGKRGLLQAESTKNALAFKSGLMDAATYTEKTRELNRRMGAAAPSGDVAAGLERLQKANESGSYSDTAKELLKPKNWKALGALVGESAVATAENIPTVVAGGVMAGPTGAAAASGATSFAAEYGAAIGDLLEKKGIDPSDTLAVRNALEDPAFLAEARERGLKRGIPVAAFDALSAGFAGRFIRTLEKAAGVKSVAKATTKEAGVQVGSGMAGEAVGQAATGETKPLDVFIEGLAELPGGVAEAGGNLYNAQRAQPTTVAAEEEVAPTTQEAGLKFTPLAEAQPEQPAKPPVDLATAKTSTDANGTVWVMTGREEPTGNSAIGRPIWEKLETVQAENEQRASTQTPPTQPAPSTEGAPNVGQPIDETGGVSPELAGQPDQVAPAGGVEEPIADGVVPAGADVGSVAEGAGTQPSALTFTTAKGSVYTVDADGKTSRTKNSEGAGQGTTYEPHTALYVQPGDHTEILSDMQGGMGDTSVRLGYVADNTFTPVENAADIPQGAQPTVGVFNKKDGAVVGLYPAETTPQIGLHPVEKLYTPDGMSNTHIGNQIVDIQEGAPSGVETPEAVQAEAQGQEAPTAPVGVTPEAETPEQQKVRSQKELNDEWARAQDVYQKSFASTKFKTRGVKQRALEKLNPQELMQWLKSFWPVATKAQREVMARLPSIEFLGKWVEDFGVTQISQASDLMTALLGKQKVLTEDTEQLLFRLKKAFKADPTLQDKLSKLVYETTNAEVDPSDPNATERVPQADADYAALGEEGQALYKAVKEHYEQRGELYLKLLEDNIARLDIDEAQKQNLMAVLRKHYETGNRIKPYFPFVRDDGQYWLSVGEGDKKEFYIYDSLRKRDADRARIIRERGLSADDTKVGNSVESLRQSAYEASALLRGVFDAIDATPAHKGEDESSAARYKESLKDAVYQSYLNVMPERSFRGMFKHRKGRAGYRTDLVQNIATTDGKMNIQLARLEFAQQIRDTVDSAQSAIEGREDLQPFVDELRKRVDMFLSPAPHNAMDAIAGIAGRIGFLYMLGGISLPLLQPLALASSGLSILWGNYKQNPATVGAALLNAFANIPTYGFTSPTADGGVRYHWPSLVNSKTLKGDELRAVQELAKSGVHESTLAREVWEHASTPTSSYVKEAGKEVEYYAARTMKGIDTVVGSPFHIMEKWTRESLFLAAYRLGIKDGLGHDAAVKKAFDNIKEALGDYDTHAKPRWMQRGLGKMAFALKTFAVLITQQTLGNLFKAIPLLNKEGKKEAIKKFSGIMLTMGLLAGASGVPLATVFYSFAAGLVMALGGGDDDDEDELREMDTALWFRSVWLPKHIPDVEIMGVKMYDWLDRGVMNAVTGLDFASRLQVATIWGQETPKPTKTPMDAALNLVKDMFAGAYFGLIEQWANAYNAYSLGDNQKAKELISPKAIKDWMKAERYEKEGVQFAGKEVIPKGELTPLEIWGQRIGFAPDIIAITQKEGVKAAAAQEKVRIERERLLTKLDIADRKDSPEGDAEFDRIMDEEVDAFNEKFPNAELSDSDINDALLTRQKIRDDAIAGVTVTEKQADALGPLLDRMEKRLDERSRKMRQKE